MASAQEIAASVLKLTDEEFFGADSSALNRRERQLMDAGFVGVAANAPTAINIDKFGELPIVIASRCSGKRAWDVPLRENCFLVGTNLRDASVSFGRPFVTERELASRGGRVKREKGPAPDNLPTAAATVRRFDARQKLKMKWQPGSWSLGVIHYDWGSNTVTVKLTREKPEEEAPVPKRVVDPEPNLAGVVKGGVLKKPVESLPCYSPMSRTPKIAKPGAAFAVEHVFGQGAAASLSIYGAFLTTVRDYHLPGRGARYKFADGQEETVAAVVPITLALVDVGCKHPYRYDWAVPIYGKDELRPGAPTKGYFALAVGGEGPKLPPGKYAAYVIVDGMICGPEMLESKVVAP